MQGFSCRVDRRDSRGVGVLRFPLPFLMQQWSNAVKIQARILERGNPLDGI